MKFNKLLLLAIFVGLAVPTFSQKFLEKPYQKWSKEEAMKVLSDSPWTETYQSTEGMAGVGQQQVARQQADNRIGGSNRGSSSQTLAIPPVVLRLNSALPVRQAIVRLQQIQENYDKLPEAQRSQFDQAAKTFLDCPICRNYYIVTITKFKDSSRQTVDEGILQTMKFENLKGEVWLTNDKGEKRELVQFTPPKAGGDSAVFYFKRTDDTGNLLLTPESKQLKFVFSNDFLNNRNAYGYMLPRTAEFKVSKLIIGNEVEF